MSYFEDAFEVIMLHEGGYVNHPDDPGGATNWGVSLRFLKSLSAKTVLPDADVFGDLDGDGDLDADDIKLMSEGFAKDVYKRAWWDKHQYELITDKSVAVKLIDFAVNMGQRRAAVNLQRACRCLGTPLVEDGLIGPVTFGTINDLDAEPLVYSFMSEVAGYYRRLDRPMFIKGWLRRAYSSDGLYFD